MLEDIIKRNDSIHCYECHTGKNYTGMFCYDKNSIKVRLFCYEKPFYIDETEPIYLYLENNDYLSMFGNYGGPGAFYGGSRDRPRNVHFQDINTNFALVGPDKWDYSNHIKFLRFDVPDCDDLFSSDEIHDFDFRQLPDHEILYITNIKTEDVEIEIRYAYHRFGGLVKKHEIWPTFQILFLQECNINNYSRYLHSITSFLSFTRGTHFAHSNLIISDKTFSELEKIADEQSYIHEYHAISLQEKSPAFDENLWIGGTPIFARGGIETDAFTECAESWMRRIPDWWNAYALMMGCLKLNRILSVDRLIKGCRWFEEIPLTGRQNTVADIDVEKIALTAASCAEKLGYHDLKSRISGTVKQIKTETRNALLSRLVQLVIVKFPSINLDDNFVKYLMLAFSIRDRSAHGHYEPEGDAEFQKFAKATYAVEALCFLLMAVDLPISKEGTERIASHNLIQRYKECHV